MTDLTTIITFKNHPPLKVAGKSVTLWDAAEIVADTNPQFGHDFLGYLTTKSGKRIYVSSENSGMCYDGRSPKSIRRVEKNPLEWLQDRDMYYTHGHLINPKLIIDLETL